MGIWKKYLSQHNWEYLLPALAVLSLLISSIIVSSKKFFWNDELLSFYLLNDRSLPHMLVAWSDKFNQAPPFYFIAGWAWDKLFGSTELSLRLFSSVCMSLACTIVWTVLRRTYDFGSTTVGTLSVFCLSSLVLYQNAEVRMYGLFIALCALALCQFDSINRKQKHAWQSLLINSLTHCTLVLTHLYGVFYSTAILAAFIAYDQYSGSMRKNVYLSVLIGWLPLVFLVRLLINQSDNAAKWFVAFTFAETMNLLIPFANFAWFIVALLIISVFLTLTGSTKRNIPVAFPPEAPQRKAEISLLLLAVCFMLVPIATWVITVTWKPILSDRYLLPTITISWTILLTHLIARIMPEGQDLTSLESPRVRTRFRSLNLRTFVLTTLALSFLLYPIGYAKNFSEYGDKPGENDSSYGYLELPIATEAGHDFLSRFYYSSKPSRYFHILDWETAVNNVTSAYATGDYVHINALSHHYPLIQSIQSADFLRKYDRFLVLNETDQKWFETRVQNSPDYRIKLLGEQPGANAPLTMYLVERLQ